MCLCARFSRAGERLTIVDRRFAAANRMKNSAAAVLEIAVAAPGAGRAQIQEAGQDENRVQYNVADSAQRNAQSGDQRVSLGANKVCQQDVQHGPRAAEEHDPLRVSERERIGVRRRAAKVQDRRGEAPKSSENRTEAKSAPQKESAQISLAFSSSRRPSVRAARLAPPTANRLDTAVSIRNAEETTVTAAVCRGSFRSPTK